MTKKIIQRSRYRNICHCIHHLNQVKLSLINDRAKIATDFQKILYWIKFINKSKQHADKYIQKYKEAINRVTTNEESIQNLLQKHVASCLMKMPSQMIEIYPQLKRKFKIDKQNSFQVFQAPWSLIIQFLLKHKQKYFAQLEIISQKELKIDEKKRSECRKTNDYIWDQEHPFVLDFHAELGSTAQRYAEKRMQLHLKLKKDIQKIHKYLHDPQINDHSLIYIKK